MRMFATEGDSVNGGRPRTTNGHGGHPDGLDAATPVLRRLRSRVDRNVRLLDRMRADPLAPAPPGLPELIDTARRLQHDAESLLLLAGEATASGGGAPRQLSTVLDDAVDATEEPMRVDVRGGPSATVDPDAATELLHVVAEVVDHVTAVHPSGRVEVSARADAPGGVVVEIRADGATRHDPRPGARGLAAAERMAERSRSGIVLRAAPPAPGAVSRGPIASVHCPDGVVVVDEPPYRFTPYEPESPALLDRTPPYADVDDRPVSRVLDRFGPSYAAPSYAAPRPEPPSPFASWDAPAPSNGHAHPPVDELFGPLVDLPADLDEPVNTPIFEAIASAWFREEAPEPRRGHHADPLDWESPSDGEWRAAAERVAQPDPAPLTAQGLPRRRPGGQLVPPRAPENGAAERPDRVPDRVRERLSGYQRGLRQGRHRADPGDPAAW